ALMLHDLTVPAEAAGQRLDQWLAAAVPGLTRSQVQKAIDEGRAGIEPGKARAGWPLRGGERAWIELPEVEVLSAEPEDIPLSVLHEDDHLIAIDKPPGMVVHPAIGHPRGTLVNAVLGRWAVAGGDPARPGIVHRLDADTSGVILVARTVQALAFLQEQFRERRVRKRYLALVGGNPATDWLKCSEPIGRHPTDIRKRVCGGREPKEAETSCLVLARRDGWSVWECRPKTGRTHQIRVHCAKLGHPILADALYGRGPVWPPQHPVLRRQALHAWSIEIPHPAGGTLALTAPVPADLRALCGEPVAKGW
ncbi:MAG: hypothetical protein RLZZ127_3305, partial [Planctomycetota bacterium]